MTKTRVIRVFSFIMALTLVFAMCSAPSYAISPRQFGAWVASALTALNITAQSTIGPMLNWGNDFNDYLSAPFKIEGTQIVDVPYTWSDDEIDQYLKQSTISFTGDYIEIDGKHYQDIWLSNEAAEKFRVNAFDIKSAWNIASNSNGTYVSGTGFVDEVPVYTLPNGTIESQLYITGGNGTYSLGSAILTNTYDSTTRQATYSIQAPYGSISNPGTVQPNKDKFGAGFKVGSYITLYSGRYEYLNDMWYVSGSQLRVPQSYYNQTPFDFDWTAGEIPADEQLDPTEGLHLYVPSDPSEWTDSPDTQTIINNYNTYLTNNPDIEPDVDLDLNTPGLLDKIGDLLDILGPIIDLMKPSFGPQGQEPTPPVPPVPGDTIADTPWDSLVDWLQRILNKLDDILGIRDVLNNFKTAFDTAISSVLNWLSQIKNLLDSILDALSDLVDTIVNGNADWFSDIVDAIKKPFLNWLNIFKSGVSIWHYVVEWLQNISAPFSFFWNVLSSSYSIYLSPFYAVAAASIVIAIYRRFGK